MPGNSDEDPTSDMDDEPSEAESTDDSAAEDDPNRDPKYIERDAPPGLNGIDEPLFTDEQLRALLGSDLGDIADEEWEDMCKESFTRSASQLTHLDY